VDYTDRTAGEITPKMTPFGHAQGDPDQISPAGGESG
jgi:hypothetical protein